MMDHQQLKYQLEDLANRAGELAKQLGRDGEPLDRRQRELCRLAMMPMFQEATDLLRIEFYMGNVGRFDEELDRLMSFGEFMLGTAGEHQAKERKRK